MHGGEESWKAEEMVAMEMGDEDGAEGLELEVAAANTVLRTFGAVEEEFESVDIDDLGTAATVARGESSSGTEDGDVKIHFRIEN
jgi:hypothetical protein